MLHTQKNDHLDDDEIDLRYYWSLIRRFQWQLAGLSATLTIIAVLVALALTPIYQATTSILIKSEEVNTVAIQQVVGVDYKQKSYYDTQYELLKSREIAELVAKRLKLSTHPLFDPRQKEQSFSLSATIKDFLSGDEGKILTEEEQESAIFASVVKSLQQGTTISPVKDTQIVNVSFTSKNPELAAKVSNAIADAYIENHMASKIEMTSKASDWLKLRAEDLKKQLLKSEATLQDFKEKEKLIDVAGVQSIKAKEIEQLAEKLVEIRQKKSQLQNTYQQIEKLKNEPIDEIMAVSSIIQQPLIQGLKQQETEAAVKVAELSKRYGERHPRMRAAMNELSNAQERLKKQVFNLISAQKKEYEILSDFERSLRRQMAKAKEEYRIIERKTFELETLKRDVESNLKLYDLFLTRAKETVEASGFSTAHARIIDKAKVPEQSIKPKKKLIVLLTFILSVMLGIGLIVLYDMLDNTIKTPADVENFLHSSVLGILPLVKSNQEKTAFKGFIEDKKSAFAEAVRTIRTGVLLSHIDLEKRVFVVSSSIPNEGKSTVSVNLAAALGQMHKTLIIDADMRRPTLAKTFNLSKQLKGLSELVTGSATLEQCLVNIENADITVLSAGLIPANPLELLSSERFKEQLNVLKEQFDNIIIDSPPTQSVSDSLVLSTIADSVIYVVKADSTNRNLAASGIARIKSVQGKVSGVILNQVNLDKKSYYSYDYLAGYYDSYSYGSDNKS